MERFRNMSGLLSIVVMFVLAVALSAMVNQPDNDQQKPQPATTESKVAKPQGSMALASVVLPPPPAPANKPKRSEETRGARPKQPLANISPPIPRASAAKVVSIDPATESDGRTLLRMLEIGKGPAIEIAWPAETDQRDQLYQIFINCFGMKAALLDIQDRLYTNDSKPGVAWRPNLDQFSSFMRRPTGALPNAEKREAGEIRKRHNLTDGTSVRLFPRRIDAVLLGGLKRIVGGQYESGVNITATYVLKGTRVTIDRVKIGNIEKKGQIVFPTMRKCFR